MVKVAEKLGGGFVADLEVKHLLHCLVCRLTRFEARAKCFSEYSASNYVLEFRILPRSVQRHGRLGFKTCQ
jgi:hypothetical protein